MRVFRCDCGLLVFFENTQCVNCEHRLAYLPDLGRVAAIHSNGVVWHATLPKAHDAGYRLCANYSQHNVCNWAVPADDPDTLCASCRLTTVIPNLQVAGHKDAWAKLEAAKRRLVYSLQRLGLPLPSASDDENRLSFEFLADEEGKPVLTGHAGGTITVNIAEADDAERERRRLELGEPYRTILGHFRHESGHYFWDRLIQDRPGHAAFRKLFGDEREDYATALEQHHGQGAPTNWPDCFISAYASAHPWEDWAESWAHYLHMTDALETAADCGLSLRGRRPGDPAMKASPRLETPHTFAEMCDDWFALTYVLNNLNRGLGLPDGYPFVLSPPVVEKLRFVHHTIDAA